MFRGEVFKVGLFTGDSFVGNFHIGRFLLKSPPSPHFVRLWRAEAEREGFEPPDP